MGGLFESQQYPCVVYGNEQQGVSEREEAAGKEVCSQKQENKMHFKTE